MTDSELCLLDKKVLWHPYTQMKDFEHEDLLLIDRAKGIFLYGAGEKVYYDTISSWWCIVHGHAHPKLRQAVCHQFELLEQIHFAATTHRPAIKLAARLVELTPDALTRVFFSDNGSTSCEVALKMSFQYWLQSGRPEKQRFISLEHGYHGDTIGTMSVGGTPGFHSPFEPLRYESYHIPSPYCYRCPFDKDKASCNLECINPLKDILSVHASEIAAIILEPLLQGAGGMIVYPAAYLKEVERLCRKYDIHLILDEVATGFGRTGTFFAHEQAGIVPDFLCLSKGLTGGCMPMAATLTTEEVYSAFYDDYEKGKTFFHGHTFTANPLAASCALASLDIFRDEDTLSKAAPVMAELQEEKERFRSLDFVGDVRGIGMVAAFELVKDPVTKEHFPADKRVGWQVYKRGLDAGLILRPLDDVVYLLLPLCTDSDQLADILERTYGVISSLREYL